ncbi:hypothetical protein SAMN04515671_2940 [Nakamurella panacisegetis]|uniref:Holliday junction resolvase RusA (Prophage-encoded endonuclease) n=2 Tax=Nakamurella panacisegetis TaxID=1090615 RepID=A0A1H0PZJ9_9ACTN|nr:hypothetical protein SAMN04515671_2940 [Nakamurella panacisegetis]
MPWPAPPLRSNHRLGTHAKARVTRDIRHAAKLTARPIVASVGPLPGPLHARFVWVVTNRIQRDVGASTPTMKAALDGMRDAGLIPEDHWGVIAEESYRIELADTPSCRIELTPDKPAPMDWSVTE